MSFCAELEVSCCEQGRGFSVMSWVSMVRGPAVMSQTSEYIQGF